MSRRPERWVGVPVEGWGRLYQVSNRGRVRRTDTGAVLRPRLEGPGKYVRVRLQDAPRAKEQRIHRLVAKAFLPPETGKTEVNHIDGDKTHNDVTNLEWTDRKGNMSHYVALASAEGRYLNSNSKLTHAQVREIRRLSAAGGWSAKRLGEAFGVGRHTVRLLLRGKTWGHVE